MKVCVTKFQSVNNKKAEILELINVENSDVICGSETWLNNSINSAEVFPSSHVVLRADRQAGIHGGALIAIKSDFTVERINTPPEIEAVFAKIYTWNAGPK